MNVYVGCGLTGAPEDFKAFVASFKSALRSELGLEVFEFLGTTEGTPTDVYLTDLTNVETCDAFIAIVDEPSTGLGMELQHAIEIGKPALCLAREGLTITRMVRGAAELGKVTLVRYTDQASAVAAVGTFLATA